VPGVFRLADLIIFSRVPVPSGLSGYDIVIWKFMPGGCSANAPVSFFCKFVKNYGEK